MPHLGLIPAPVRPVLVATVSFSVLCRSNDTGKLWQAIITVYSTPLSAVVGPGGLGHPSSIKTFGILLECPIPEPSYNMAASRRIGSGLVGVGSFECK